jgi:hypothetical protein
MDLRRGRLTRAEFNRLSAAAAIPLKPQPVSLVRSERDLSPLKPGVGLVGRRPYADRGDRL